MKTLFCLHFYLILLVAPQILAKNTENLQHRVEILEKERDLLRKDFDNKKIELSNEFIEYKNMHENGLSDTRRELKKDYNILKVLSLVFGSIVLISIIIGVMKIRNYVETTVKKRIGEVLNDKKGLALDMLALADTEIKLKTEKKIVVLTPKNSDDKMLKKYLSLAKFENVHFQELSDKWSYDNADVVLFNDKDELFDKAVLKDLLNRLSMKTIRFYFGHSKINVPDQFKDITAFANATLQLYGNLVNALRYQSIL